MIRGMMVRKKKRTGKKGYFIDEASTFAWCHDDSISKNKIEIGVTLCAWFYHWVDSTLFSVEFGCPLSYCFFIDKIMPIIIQRSSYIVCMFTNDHRLQRHLCLFWEKLLYGLIRLSKFVIIISFLWFCVSVKIWVVNFWS